MTFEEFQKTQAAQKTFGDKVAMVKEGAYKYFPEIGVKRAELNGWELVGESQPVGVPVEGISENKEAAPAKANQGVPVGKTSKKSK